MYQPKKQLELINLRIAEACIASQREPESVTLLAASKKQNTEKMLALHESGVRHFGENYVSEALEKQSVLQQSAPGIQWHFIGPIQSNKTRKLAESFHWVQSVDRLKVIHRLERQRPADLGKLNILLQINIDNEPQKAGALIDDIEHLADAVAQSSRLSLRGLMAIPKPLLPDTDDFSSYASLQRLFNALQSAYQSVDTLSVGMSADLEAAIRHGSTMVRIGSGLLGSRT